LKIRKKKEKSNIPPPPFAFHFSPILGMTKSLSGVRTSQKKKNGKIKKRNFFSLFALHADELKKIESYLPFPPTGRCHSTNSLQTFRLAQNNDDSETDGKKMFFSMQAVFLPP
jgi:hypothetical protein